MREGIIFGKIFLYLFSALKIHASSECKELLERLGGYVLEERGKVAMKVISFKLLENFDKICQEKAYFAKYLRGYCLLKHQQQLPFKYCVRSILTPKLLSKVF